MRTRMVVCEGAPSVAIWDEAGARWLPLSNALGRAATDGHNALRQALEEVAGDMVAFLAAGEPARLAALELANRLADEAFDLDLSPRLPFAARSLRPFLLSPAHGHGVVRGMTARYVRDPGEGQAPAAPPRGRSLMTEIPLTYQGNHNALVPSGTPIATPAYGRDLDFELELGFLVVEDVRDAGLERCRAAIGGLVVLNDISLRDTQWEEVRGSPLGPIQKCKSFATAMSSEVLTADEALSDLAAITGTVDVDGEQWASGRADDFAHTLEACLARLCEGETVFAGELLSTGTLAGCSGIELGRLPMPGATVALNVPCIGTVTNRFGEATT